MTGRDRQTVADLAVEHCGDADSMFGIMSHNDIEASSEVAGMELEDEDVSAKRAVDYIRTQGSSPACVYEEEDDVLTANDGTVEVTTEEFETITA
ncbi:MAG: hypothetical protein IKN61_04080 [Bacteroidaceae bacterium]|nr:hypothetical protein [Bacteroidaceae bacterium]